MKSYWLQQYRSEKYRKGTPLPRETIVRDSIKEVVVEFMSNCSLAGAHFLTDSYRGKKERIFWGFVLLSTLMGVLYVVNVAWEDFMSKPLIVSLESNVHPIAEVEFPAVAICNMNKISLHRAKAYAKKLYPLGNFTLEEIERQVTRMGMLLDHDITYHRFMTAFIEALLKKNPFEGDVDAEMRNLAPSCEEMLLNCYWAGLPYDCMELFKLRRTGVGHCCIFNYLRNYTSNLALLGEPVRQTVPGSQFGISVMLDAMVDDYAYPIRQSTGFDVLIFDPRSYADLTSGGVQMRNLQPENVLFLELHSTVQRSTREVRHYSAETRGCLFHAYDKDTYGGVYTYGSCLAECRMRTAQAVARCTPYYMPAVGAHFCTLLDTPRLNKYREKLMYIYPMNASSLEGLELEVQDSLYCLECLPNCDFTTHKIKSYSVRLDASIANQGQHFPYPDYTGRYKNLSGKSMLLIYQPSTDATLNRYDAVFYWYELISNFGGLGGVFVGFSIVLPIEIIYFACIRFPRILRRNFIKYS